MPGTHHAKGVGPRDQALLATTFASIFFGLSWVVAKAALTTADPFWLLFLRFAVATPVCIIIGALMVRVRNRGRNRNHSRSAPLIPKRRFGTELARAMRCRTVWLLAAINSIAFVFEFAGLAQTSAIKAALLVNLYAVYVAIASRLIFKEAFGPVKIVGVVLSPIGMVLLVTGGDLGILGILGTGQLVGDLLAISGGLVWTGYIILVRRLGIQRPEIDMLAVTTVVLGCSAAVLLPIALRFGNPASLAALARPHGLAAVGYLAVVATALGYVLWSNGLRTLSATVSTIILLAGILVGIGASILVLGETLTLIGTLGAELIGLSVVLIVVRYNGPRPSCFIARSSTRIRQHRSRHRYLPIALLGPRARVRRRT